MTTTKIDRDALVEDEWYTVRYSGEIPEVAYHSSIYHLTSDDDGPQLELTVQQHNFLIDAVKQRYIDIILRDLLPTNKYTGGYRGVRRSLINWRRFILFCEQYQLDAQPMKLVVGETLSEFLEHELKYNNREDNNNRLNCTWLELLEYVHLLGLETSELPDGSRDLCIVWEDKDEDFSR